MKSAITILKEQLNNMYLIFKLALFDLKSANKNHYLGMLWEVITPGIRILIYWLVFGVGIRNRADVELGGETVPFIYWLMTGFMVWLFFSKSASSGAKAIFSKLRVVSKMNFPMIILPNYTILSKFLVHVVMGAIIIIILPVAGSPMNIYYLHMPYFMFATYFFTFSFVLICSTLCTLVRDIYKLLTSTMRIGIYISPILWDVTEV